MEGVLSIHLYIWHLDHKLISYLILLKVQKWVEKFDGIENFSIYHFRFGTEQSDIYANLNLSL